MISATPLVDLLERNRLLVIRPSSAGAVLPGDDFAGRHPDWSLTRCESYLSGISELIRRPARAVAALVQASDSRLGQAVAGLREADPAARLVLCCPPEAEPLARDALPRGADDYLVLPADAAEWDAVLGLGPDPRLAAWLGPADANRSLEEAELAAMADAMAAMDRPTVEFLQKLAELVRIAMRCAGVTVVADGVTAAAGQPVIRPVLIAPVNAPAGQEGPDRQAAISARILLGEPKEAYTTADARKLEQYAGLIGHLLAAESRRRYWRQLALIDVGSGLPNRRYLHDHLQRILQEAEASRFPVTVLLFDVDDFKSFNDRHGHDAGDEILRVIGQLFRSSCREQDVVTRYGGDEFAVVFWDPAGPREAGSKHPDQALSVLDRFTAALRSQRFSRIGADGGQVTISAGLATYPWDAMTLDALIAKADQALLAAKRAGKNRVFRFSGD